MTHYEAMLWCEGERDRALLAWERANEVNHKLTGQAVEAFRLGDQRRGYRLARAALRCRTIARFWRAYADRAERTLGHHADQVLMMAGARGVA